MAEPVPNREEQIREVLINAVEVQLAALKAAVSFWGEWMERTSAFVKTASQTLSTIRSPDREAGQVLLEVVDAGRESMRTLTELPRHAALRFIDELDAIDTKRSAAARGATGRARGTRPRGAAAKPTPKRRVRVKS